MRGLIKRTNTVKSPKSFKGNKSQEDGCSRVGSSFQAHIPEYTEEIDCHDSKNSPHKEFSVWMPNQQPDSEKLNSYLEFAKQYQYTQELALILLHWHNYDIEKAIDDIPNYSPAYSKWTKNEVKKFLRCIDSKPRKDFVEAKRTVPGRHMGDICALYYSIAAPFKAGNRSKYHNELIEQCYSRAVRAGLVTCRWQKSSSIEETLINTPKPEVIEDPLEGEIKSFLVNLVGASKATELLGNGLLSSPQSIEKPIILHSPEKSTQNVSPSSPIEGSSAFVRLDNDLSPTTMPTTNDSQTSSSEVSSQNDSDSVCQGKGKGHSLPSGAYYDHEEFLSFLNMTSDQLLQEKETELSYLQNINEELHEQIDITEARSRSVLYNMDLLKPSEGFPQISYRWTKTDLAFVLTAMSKYGHDFATIAQSVGTKSESFIRDFYNRFRDRFTLDSIIKSSDHTEEHLTQNPKVDEDSICQDPLVVLTQDHLDMTKILTDGTCVKVSQLAEEMPSHQNENVKIEYEELNHLTAQSQSISDSQTTEDNLRLSPRRHSIPIKLIDSSVLIHTPISESSQISTTPSSSSGRERLRAKRLKRS